MRERVRWFVRDVFVMAAGALLFAACGSSAPEAEHARPEPATETTAEAAQAEEDLRGEDAARALMAQWRRHNPSRQWIEAERESHMIVDPADNSALVGNPQGTTYGSITERDVQRWQRETLALVVEGSRVFHSADELGSTIGVSCDMCHPDGANTHPETYPKFQVQMGRVALLRDMINWCIEQASRGEILQPNDPKMRALEAYIYAQRRGTDLDYGRR